MKGLNIQKVRNLSFSDKLAISGYIMLAFSLVGYKIYMATGEQLDLFEPGKSSSVASVDQIESPSALASSAPHENIEQTSPAIQEPQEQIALQRPQAHTATTQVVSHRQSDNHSHSEEQPEPPKEEAPAPQPTPEPTPLPPIDPIPPIEPPHDTPSPENPRENT